MKYILLCAIPLLFTLSCRKNKSETQQNPFNINGISDLRMESNQTQTIPLEIKYISGEQKNVSLSITGMPQGVMAKFSTTSGIPDFNSNLIVTTDTAVAEGNYPLIITCSDGTVEKNYEFTLHLKDCLGKLIGIKTGLDLCDPEQYSYEAQVFWGPEMEETIYIAGFGGLSGYIYAEIDCEKGTVTIPQQLVTGSFDGSDIVGNGTFSGKRMDISYTLKSGNGLTEICTSVLQ